jgi:hypothetical protein
MVDSSLIFAKKIIVHNEIDKIILNKDKLSVAIDKNQLHISKQSSTEGISKGVEIHSVVGILETQSNSYLLCVGGAEYIGNIIDSNVFRITQVEVFNIVYIYSL